MKLATLRLPLRVSIGCHRVLRNALIRSRKKSITMPNKRRCRIVIASCVVVILAGLAVQWWKPWLNETERRFLGVWTWKHAPGEMTIQYRDDGTLRYTRLPVDPRVNSSRWYVEGDVLYEDYEKWSWAGHVQSLRLGPRSPEEHQIRFNPDGSITLFNQFGTQVDFIPWNSDVGEYLKDLD